MYKMLWSPLVCMGVSIVVYFSFMSGKLSIAWLWASIGAAILGALVVLSNKETSIEQPRYGIAIVLSIATLLLVLIPWVVLQSTIQ